MSLATDKIEDFGDRYGEEAIEFACYAAFPLALTTELCYRLREKFADKLDWWVAPELLLSGLCEQVRHDLYAMHSEVRLELLRELVDIHGKDVLDEVANFMGKYLDAAITTNKNFRLQAIGQPELVKHFALCLLRPNDSLAQKIKQDLSKILQQTTDPRECFELARMVEKQRDFLADHGFELMSLAEFKSLLQGIESNALNEFGQIKQSVSIEGFPELQSKVIEYAKAEFKEDAIETGDALYEFVFETVRVNDEGEVIDRRILTNHAFKEPLEENLILDMVAIPQGTFMMGSPETEKGYQNFESPQHLVNVPGFFMSKFPITQAQWHFVMNLDKVYYEMESKRSMFKGDNHPVNYISTRDAHEFCARLSIYTGRAYRLPSEAEWEYACRANTTTPFYFGSTITMELANYNASTPYSKASKGISRGATTPVGIFPANNFGLHDMHGNVWELCQDIWYDSYQGAPIDGSKWDQGLSSKFRAPVLRGGSWYFPPELCRSASRDISYFIGISSVYIGFRVVCDNRHWRYYYARLSDL